METFIRDAFIKKEHVVAVFFDLEKAYDTTWRYGILKDIHKLGLRGRLPTFIENFLADRTMQVRVGSSLSDYYDQEQGVPQGGVLSTTLFSIKINDIVKCLGNLTDCSLYVDDFCICYRSKSMATIERQLQQNLNKIENWATSNGFKFSKSKTQCVHFCQLRKQHDDPVLHLYGSPIPVVEESKFLGILFDRKLSFIPHITLESPYHLVAVSGAHFTQGTILIVILVSSGSAKSRTHQSAVGGFLVTRRGWPGRLRACRIWTFINSV